MNRVQKSLILAGALGASLLGQVYEGPSVLSRGGSSRPYGARSTRDMGLRLYGSIAGFADSGFFPAALGPGGSQVQLGTNFGTEASLGTYGIKRFSRGQIGLDYNGTFRYYPNGAGINGSDHFLGFDFQRVFTERIAIRGQSTAGTSNRVFSFANLVGGNAGSSFLPLNDLFDARVYFLRTSMGVTYRLTKRLQVELQADGFNIRRVNALTGVNGYSAGASVNYRLNQRQWVGALYNFIHFDYPKAFGESDIQMFGGVFVHNFTRRIQLETTAGAFRSDVAGTRVVAADPIVRELLGIDQIAEAFSRASVRPMVNINLRAGFRQSSVALGYSRTPSAGNGVLQTSTGESFNGSYSYTPDRRSTFSFSGNVMRASSLGADLPGFASLGAAGNASYLLRRGFQVFSTIQYRYTDVVFERYPKNTYRIGIGITYSNSAVPVTYF